MSDLANNKYEQACLNSGLFSITCGNKRYKCIKPTIDSLIQVGQFFASRFGIKDSLANYHSGISQLVREQQRANFLINYELVFFLLEDKDDFADFESFKKAIEEEEQQNTRNAVLLLAHTWVQKALVTYGTSGIAKKKQTRSIRLLAFIIRLYIRNKRLIVWLLAITICAIAGYYWQSILLYLGKILSAGLLAS
jgi:hypothetical protein